MAKYFYMFFLLSFNLFSQNYSLITKVEKNLNSENPNLKKAEKLLNRAEKSDYGFCGSAKLSADSEIDFLRAKILFLKNDFKKCLNKLESEDIWIRRYSSDSLKIECLIKMHGKEKISNLIYAKTSEIIKRNNYNYKGIYIRLEEINYTFCFLDQNENINYNNEVTLLEILKETNFYNLIKPSN